MSIDDSVFLRSEPWTREDLDLLPDGYRYEILDGRLLVSPKPRPIHQIVLSEVHRQLLGQLEPEYDAVWDADITLGVNTLRVPDLLVVDYTGLDPYVSAALDPSRIRLAVEAVSPSSVTDDRIRKPAEYAAAGIPHYWRIEVSPVGIAVGVLANGVYRVSEAGTTAATPYAVDLSRFLT